MESHRPGKLTKVKNKAAASVQITAEQLLREAKERQLEYEPPPPRQKFADPEELAEFKLSKRKDFEDQIRRNRAAIGIWIRYAQWEASQNEWERARSIYERALDVDHRNVAIWLKYAEMEMKNRQVNHARNIFDRATTILPRVNQFWYKYTYMEEQLGNVAGCRQIFERWMKWHPDEQAWNSYINMELRYEQVERARAIYERYVLDMVEPKYWIKYAKFEAANGEYALARQVYERAVEFFGDANIDESLYVNFAKFEETQREYERARAIYKYSLEKIPKEQAKTLFAAYTQFEKKFGDRTGIEEVITSKRRFQYEEEVKANPSNYDAWFDYLRLCEEEEDVSNTRDVYERAIANVPPAQEKRLWRRYIYLWINYAIFEELNVKDIDRCRDVYRACLDIIPHATFTFAKIWLLFAHFEIRQKNVKAARTILGTAIGKCPKDKLFKGYIRLEQELREFDRCRKLYDKFLEFNSANCTTWADYAEFETLLRNPERARAIYEIAVEQPVLDMPEVLWKAFIDFETVQGEYDRARELFERLLQRTNHPKVWISYAQFEASLDSEESLDQARHVYETADKEAKKNEDKSQRLMLLESWLEFERENGSAANVQAVQSKMPRKVKRRREVFAEDGTSEGWEEYYDYIYPDEETRAPVLNLLEMAHKWKATQQFSTFGDKKQQAAPEDGDDGGDDGDDDDQGESMDVQPEAPADDEEEA